MIRPTLGCVRPSLWISGVLSYVLWLVFLTHLVPVHQQRRGLFSSIGLCVLSVLPVSPIVFSELLSPPHSSVSSEILSVASENRIL